MLKIPSVSEAEKLIEEKLGGWIDIVIAVRALIAF